MRRNRDHAGVVGAVFKFGNVRGPAFALAEFLEFLAKVTVGTDAPGDGEVRDAVNFGCFLEIAQQITHNPALVARADVVFVFLDEVGIGLDFVTQQV